MDNQIKVELMKLDDPDSLVDPESEGAVKVSGSLLAKPWVGQVGPWPHASPVGSAYRIVSEKPATAIFQTVEGKETIQRWAQICQSGLWRNQTN